MKVSVFGSWARPAYWPTRFAEFANNTIEYEIVIAGPTRPRFKLPANVTFIYCDPDPASCHCSQLAANLCRGETMLLAGDDLEYTPHILDNLYKKYVQEQDYKCMVYSRYGRVKYVDETEKYAGLWNIGRTPFRWGNGLWSRQFFVELGGFDVRFTVGPYDCEMQCRAFNQGGRYVYAHDALFIEDCSASPGTAWEMRGGRWEMNNLRDARWFSNGDWHDGEFFKSPTTPFEPIGDVANACVREILVGVA